MRCSQNPLISFIKFFVFEDLVELLIPEVKDTSCKKKKEKHIEWHLRMYGKIFLLVKVK